MNFLYIPEIMNVNLLITIYFRIVKNILPFFSEIYFSNLETFWLFQVLFLISVPSSKEMLSAGLFNFTGSCKTCAQVIFLELSDSDNFPCSLLR